MDNTKEKILLLLLGGLALACCRTPGRQWRVVSSVSREWKKLNPEKLKRNIDDLYRYEFVGKTKKEDGSVGFFLTGKGKSRALNFQLENIKNKKEKWDGKWRMVAFDIPQKSRKGRDALRRKLKKIGFCELQKSVFITPYNCREEIELLVDFFKLDQYVRFGVLEYVDNEAHFKRIFKLS